MWTIASRSPSKWFTIAASTPDERTIHRIGEAEMLRTLFNGCPASSGFEARTWTLLPLVFSFLAYPGLLGAQPIVVTLPAVASIQGVTPFFSDVRAFNTSYSETLDVVATYRCFLGSCPTTTV